jgi:hypothetical protein
VAAVPWARNLISPRLGVLGQQPEPPGGVSPHPLEVGLDGVQSLFAQVVDPQRAAGLFRYQAGLLEQAQVAGYSGTADRKRRSDLVDRLVALAEQAQDVAPVRVPERLERVTAGPRVLHVPSLAR